VSLVIPVIVLAFGFGLHAMELLVDMYWISLSLLDFRGTFAMIIGVELWEGQLFLQYGTLCAASYNNIAINHF
jgi:hypothetical protein